MLRELAQGVLAYREVKKADPEKVAEVEQKLADGIRAGAIVTTLIIGKLMLDNHMMKKELRIIKQNQQMIFLAARSKPK